MYRNIIYWFKTNWTKLKYLVKSQKQEWELKTTPAALLIEIEALGLLPWNSLTWLDLYLIRHYCPILCNMLELTGYADPVSAFKLKCNDTYKSNCRIFFTNLRCFFHIKRPSLNYQMRIRTSTKIVTITGNWGSQSHHIRRYKEKNAFFISNECKNRVSISLPAFGTG